jgi:hypothetical protein
MGATGSTGSTSFTSASENIDFTGLVQFTTTSESITPTVIGNYAWLSGYRVNSGNIAVVYVKVDPSVIIMGVTPLDGSTSTGQVEVKYYYTS